MLETVEKRLHLLFDVFGITKSAPLFTDSHCPELPSPLIHILKKVAVDGTIMRSVQCSRWEWLIRALRGHCRLKRIEYSLIAYTRYVFENSRSFVTIGINYYIVHASKLARVFL